MDENKMTVLGDPTKYFFIYMLTRDIGLSRSILDLVDNSVDGALRLRGERFDGLNVALNIDSNRFCIVDNCGGIPLDIARKYAFRFGRSREAEPTKHSIGQFGVGMKRALFKLGAEFRIESTTQTSRFVLQENVEDWLNRQAWDFKFSELEEPEQGFPKESHGTSITVTRLHDSVAETFNLENYRNKLKLELKEAHQNAISSGLSISLNGIPLDYDPVDLLESEQLKPVSRTEMFGEQVRVRISAGIGASEPQEAGWYVFCNGRLVLGADKTERTGWGSGGETEVPRFHNRCARFRGYVFFDAENAGLLPWNTTKTGIDSDSKIYRAVRLQMISIMRPIIDFLNKLSREMKSDEAEKPLLDVLESASPKPLQELTPSEVFIRPTVGVSRGPKTGTILYRKPLEDIKVLKRALGVWTQKEVGERTFEYFFKHECKD
ncbi:ATP-binding protein [Desulfobacterales bacterium HSG2]|nr:ATP-binding protein [Desulfobacterales bacterium HSG2]